MISPEEFPTEVCPPKSYDRAYPAPCTFGDREILQVAAAKRDAVVFVDGKPAKGVSQESKSWIQTYSKQALDPRAIDPASCRIEDIAHALACEGRFTNQTPEPYSVAQHCVIGSRLIAPRFALAFLLHELDEVYLPDLAKPLKGHVWVAYPETEERPECPACGAPPLRRWDEMAAEHEAALLKVLKLESLRSLIHSPEVKAMDWAMLAWEARDLMANPPKPWGLTVPPPTEAARQVLEAWTWYDARAAFRKRFWQLTERTTVGREVYSK